MKCRTLLKVLACGWLMLLPLWASAQGNPSATPDSLRRLLQRSRSDINRVNLLQLMGQYYVYKPGESKADLDSALAYGRRAVALARSLNFRTGEMSSMFLIGRIYYEKGETKTADLYYLQAADMYRSMGNKRGEAQVYLQLGEMHGRLESSSKEANRNYLLQAAKLFEEVGDLRGAGEVHFQLAELYGRSKEELPLKIAAYQQALSYLQCVPDAKDRQAHMLKTIADMHQQQGQLAQAMRELLEALQLYESIHYPYLHYTYDLLAHVSAMMGNYKEALQYGFASLKTAYATNDTAHTATFYNRIAYNYAELGDHAKSIEYFKKVLFLTLQTGNVDFATATAGFITQRMIELGKPQEALAYFSSFLKNHPPPTDDCRMRASMFLTDCFIALRQYPQADKYCRQMLRLYQPHSNGPDISTIGIYLRAGKLYLAMGQYDKARPYMAQALETAQGLGAYIGLRDVYLQLFRLDSAQARYPEAIRHYKQYTAFKDSLFNETKSKQLANFQVQYDTEKKEQDIKLLQQQSKLQKASIEREQLIRNVSIGGAVMLLLLLAVLYNRYQLKQRSNRLLQAQQEELMAQGEEIHVKNDYLLRLNKEKDTLLKEKDGLLVEKEWLLKEIHHRVKNNLQVIMSLLSSQTNYLTDEVALSAIEESRHRVYAMSLIHQKLYQSDELAGIFATEYIQELVDNLSDSFNLYGLIRINLDVDMVQLDVSQAVPVGLIINEAVTNALKYAFPDGRRGTITLSLKVREDGACQLQIQDDGVGLPENFNPRQDSLGMTIMRGLSRQLGGEFQLQSDGGVQISVVFSEFAIHSTRGVLS